MTKKKIAPIPKRTKISVRRSKIRKREMITLEKTIDIYVSNKYSKVYKVEGVYSSDYISHKTKQHYNVYVCNVTYDFDKNISYQFILKKSIIDVYIRRLKLTEILDEPDK